MVLGPEVPAASGSRRGLKFALVTGLIAFVIGAFVLTSTELLVGAQAVVIEQVDGRDGRVKVGGEVWSARASDGSVILEPGTTVTVDSVAGATVLVS